MGKLALVAALSSAMLTGCFGYNSSSKGWAYAGDSVLIAGGGAALALGITDKSSCKETGASCYDAPFNGATVAGAMLITAGLVGIIFNATRTEVKTSR